MATQTGGNRVWVRNIEQNWVSPRLSGPLLGQAAALAPDKLPELGVKLKWLIGDIRRLSGGGGFVLYSGQSRNMSCGARTGAEPRTSGAEDSSANLSLDRTTELKANGILACSAIPTR